MSIQMYQRLFSRSQFHGTALMISLCLWTPAMARAATGTVSPRSVVLGTAGSMVQPTVGEHARVTLVNGGFVEGKIVELEQGTFVVIEKASTKQVRLEWREIADLSRVSETSASTTFEEHATPTPGQDGGPPVGEGRIPSEHAVRIFMESVNKRQLALVRFVGSNVHQTGNMVVHTSYYKRICVAPCETVVDRRNWLSLHFAGKRTPVGPSLTLRDGVSEIRVKVKPGVPLLNAGGVSALTVGITALITGVTFLIVDAADDRYSLAAFRKSGGALTAVGSILTAGSIPMMIFGRNRVVDLKEN